MALPLKTTIDDFDALAGYLKTQVGWTDISKVKGTIDRKHADNRKLEAGKYIHFLDRDGNNIRLGDLGRQYATARDETAKAEAMLDMLLSAELYAATVHWMHFSNKAEPTRTEVGNYWHDHHSAKLDGAQGDALTDAAVFFLRVAGAAGLGQFISAGKNRPETYLKGDAQAIERAATKPPTPSGPSSPGGPSAEVAAQPPTAPVGAPSPVLPPPPAPGVRQVSASPAVHVNVEIHIAADATAATVEEVFKNMRKYVLNDVVPEDGK
ncbi:hypothetical protein JYB55_14870 [Mycolicibacterium septicum]|nr:hypothetical protein [Mycolicibacterium septicum]